MVFIDQFIASFNSPSQELILDFDAIDDPTHGRQEKTFYHGFLPALLLFLSVRCCNYQLLASYPRPSNKDGARHSGAILKLLEQTLLRLDKILQKKRHDGSESCR